MKIAIIGAGFIGLLAALELSKNGYDVSVFEKNSEPGGLASRYKNIIRITLMLLFLKLSPFWKLLEGYELSKVLPNLKNKKPHETT